MRCFWNLIALFLFFLLSCTVRWLCWQEDALARRIVRKVCWLLLGGNLLRYLVIYPIVFHTVKIPVEFSTVAYFVVPLIVLADLRSLDCWAAYSGLMAGFFYYAAMIFAGQALYGSETPENVFISLLCHGALYFCGFVLVSKERYVPQESGKLLLGLGYVVLRAAILRPLVAGREHLLIYILMDGLAVRYLFPASVWPAALPVYHALLAAFLFWSICRFFRKNRTRYRRFPRPYCCAAPCMA